MPLMQIFTMKEVVKPGGCNRQRRTYVRGSSIIYDESIKDIDPEDMGFEPGKGYRRIWK